MAKNEAEFEFERVLGPYASRRHRFVVYLVGPGPRGRRLPRYFKEEDVAAAFAKKLRERVEGTPILSVETALARYEQFRRDKGNKPTSIKETSRRLDAFFREPSLNLYSLTEERCTKYYRRFVDAGLRADSHRNYLAEARSFLKWCKRQRWLKANPLEDVEGVGRRRHGKTQLRFDEARAFYRNALQEAQGGHEGASVALTALLLGLRVSEVVERLVRDIDDDGRVLWIPEAKTEKGRRVLQVPVELQPILAARRVKVVGRGAKKASVAKGPLEYLFQARAGGRYTNGHRSKRWALVELRALCRRAGVSEVVMHSLRGLHGTLSIEAGATPHLVAAALGHESFTTTAESYLAPGTMAEQASKRAIERLK